MPSPAQPNDLGNGRPCEGDGRDVDDAARHGAERVDEFVCSCRVHLETRGGRLCYRLVIERH